MLRNRNIYIEDFFGATGEVGRALPPVTPPVIPTSPIPPVTEIQSEPVNEIAPEPTPRPKQPIVTLTDPNLTGNVQVPHTLPPTVINNYPYPVVIPRYDPNYIPPSTAVIFEEKDDYGFTQPFTAPTGGGGGGFGNGAEIDESTDMDEIETGSESSGQPATSNKKRIIWLIVIAIAVYLGYKYFKKK
jgi:hypothetical protein